MNREIKFRAYDSKNKKWLFGYEKLGGFSLFGETMLMGEWSSALNHYFLSEEAKPEDLVVVQYTGLKDKNGDKEIYEGDIVWSDCGCKGVVEFYDGVFNAHYLSDEGEIEDEWERPLRRYEITVIGNKYEHPELLRNEE